MKLLKYGEREYVKSLNLFKVNSPEYRRLQYDRFIIDAYNIDEDSVQEVHVDDNIKPSFEAYSRWMDKFPGWSCGYFTPTHSAYKKCYSKEILPMNDFLDFVSKKNSQL